MESPTEPSLSCPTCGQILRDVRAASAVADKPSPNDIFLCGHCSSLSVFTPEGMTLMSAEDFATLDEDYRKDIRFAVRNILAHAKKNIRRTLNVQRFLDQHKN